MPPHETLRTWPMDNLLMTATTSLMVRVDSLAGLPTEPLQSIVKCQVWSMTGEGEHMRHKGAHDVEGTERGSDGGQDLGLRQMSPRPVRAL
jgi:hypothetical protein